MRRSLVSLALVALCTAVAIAQTASDREFATMPIRDLVERAEQGDRFAMVAAAIRYADGIGVPRHEERSGHWARAAAEHGSVLGAALYAYWIGTETGMIQEADAFWFQPNDEHEHLYLEAYAWASIAAICDETTEGQELFDHYVGILDDEQQRVGDDLAAELFEDHFGGAIDCERDLL